MFLVFRIIFCFRYGLLLVVCVVWVLVRLEDAIFSRCRWVWMFELRILSVLLRFICNLCLVLCCCVRE